MLRQLLFRGLYQYQELIGLNFDPNQLTWLIRLARPLPLYISSRQTSDHKHLKRKHEKFCFMLILDMTIAYLFNIRPWVNLSLVVTE